MPDLSTIALIIIVTWAVALALFVERKMKQPKLTYPKPPALRDRADERRAA